MKKLPYLLVLALVLLMGLPALANNEIAAPASNCPNNLSLMPAGIEVYFSPTVQIGTVVNVPVDANVLEQLHSYLLNHLMDYIPADALLTNELDPVNAGGHAILKTNYFCIANEMFIIVLREAEMDGIQGYIVEQIVMPDLAITDEIIDYFTIEMNEQLGLAPEEDEDLGVLVPEMNLTLEIQPVEPSQPLDLQAESFIPHLLNSRFSFWRLYTLVGVGTADTLAAPETPPQNLCGDYTATSALAVGMQAQMEGYYYNQMPLSGDLSDDSMSNWLELGEVNFAPQDEYSFNYFLEALNTPIYHAAPSSLDSIFVVADAATIWEAPVYGAHTVEILAGPECREYELRDYNANCFNTAQGEVCEYEPTVEDLYSVWWQIEVTIHGETYVGWYPENLRQYSWWLWEDAGIFDRVVTAYLLTPIALPFAAGDTCESLPPSRYVAGMDVQANSAMNLRANPNGEVIGRIEAGQAMTLFGEPDCEAGMRWWQVAGGWIAENDSSNYFITPYQPPVEPTVIVEPPILLPVTPQPQPHPTRNPRGNSSSTCDPATGRGC